MSEASSLTNSTPYAIVHPFVGIVATTVDAIRLVLAAREGIIPRVARRPTKEEQQDMVKSGAVLIFSTEESGIKKWSEGLFWSASRRDGNFMIYKEVTHSIDRDNHETPIDIPALRNPLRQNSFHTRSSIKPNGLIKRTIRIKFEDRNYHVIWYYRASDVLRGYFERPTANPAIRSLPIPPEIVTSENFRQPPRVDIGTDQLLHVFDDEEAVYEAFIHTINVPSPSAAASSASYLAPPLYSRSIRPNPSGTTPTQLSYQSPANTIHLVRSLGEAPGHTASPSDCQSSPTPSGFRIQPRSISDGEPVSSTRPYEVSHFHSLDPQGGAEKRPPLPETLLPGFCYIDAPTEGVTSSSAVDLRFNTPDDQQS